MLSIFVWFEFAVRPHRGPDLTTMPATIRVLLADTQEPGVEPLESTLRGRGMDVVSAQDRAVVEGLVATEHFDVVVIDFRVTGVGTASTIKAIRRLDATTPVLLLALGSDLARMGEVLKPGLADFLLRPFPAEALVAAIRDASERESCPPLACEP
jgi:two-component system C4-dicarboxylate transport response regulator DctD